MPRLHHLRARMKSVGSIRQITKAMELVAASKVRRAQEATLRSRTYAIAVREALARLRLALPELQHPLLAHRPVRRQLFIVFTSNRGLAGAYNTAIFKAVIEAIQASGGKVATSCIVTGDKGVQFLTRLKDTVTIVGSYPEWPAQPTSIDVRPLATTAIQGFTEGTYDRVALIYTDFTSLLRQTVTVRDLLPIDPHTILPSQEARAPLYHEMMLEPSPHILTEAIVPRVVEMQVYQASLEAAASEHAMRMMVMRNASDNATDVIDDLTLLYNGMRQTAITQELAEISAGAQALS